MLGNASGIDLNNSSIDDLDTIGGLGRVRGLQIIQSRPIRRWSDLRKIEGFDNDLLHDLRGSGAKLGVPRAAEPAKYLNERLRRAPRKTAKTKGSVRGRKPRNIFSGEVPAAGLFTVGRDGSEELTPTGRSILDQCMSDLVPYLPNNPVVVEGYSASGMPDQQYIESRARALAVREHLESRFHLNPKRVGVMPLADHPPKATGKEKWDGVSLVLVVSKKQ